MLILIHIFGYSCLFSLLCLFILTIHNIYDQKKNHFFVTEYRLCKNDEFQCDSGQCIPLEYKCKKYREEQMGCVDKSHLRNCGMLNVNIYIHCHVCF